MKKFDFNKILSHIKPTSEEAKEELAVANSIVGIVNSTLSELNLGYSCNAVLTGSVAKGTFLKNKKDIDVFVLFPDSIPKDELESIILRIFHSAFSGLSHQLSYAEHPYVRFHYDGRRVDLVPAYKIDNSSQRLSAVDRSVLHTKFVNSKLKKSAISDVLLLKAFLKSNSLYGAEIKIQGFSGYLCELLIIQFGSFSKLISAATKWSIKKPLLFDLKKIYKTPKSKSEIQKKLGNFVFIDPTDQNRNVAAAVSPQSLSLFIKSCQKFSKSPHEQYFLKKPEGFDSKVKKISNSGHVYIIQIPKPDVVDDVIWGQIRKLLGQIERTLSDFEPKAIIADDNRHLISIAICLKREKLDSTMVVKGPPISMKQNVLDFKKSHKNAKFTVKKGFVYANGVKRKITQVIPAIKKFFEDYRKIGSHISFSDELLVIEKLNKKRK